MTLFWKRAVALGIAVAGVGAAGAPAEAQYYGYGHRDGWRGDRWDNRGDRRDWRDHRRWRHNSGYGRGSYDRGHHYGYRQRCWTEWRRGYHDHRMRVRICR